MLADRLHEDLKSALKSGDGDKAGVLRFLLAQIHNREIEKRSAGKTEPLTDAEMLEVLQKEAKKRKESIELFQKGGRADLADKEEKELAILAAYLPAQMSRQEIAAEIDKIITSGRNDFNSVIREAMNVLRGKAEGNLVSEVIKEKMAGK